MLQKVFASLDRAAKQNPKIACAAVASATVLLMLSYLERRESSLLMRSAPKKVSVAKLDIDQHEVITREHVQYKFIPSEFVEKDAFLSLGELQGTVAAVALPKDAQLTRSKVIEASSMMSAASMAPAGLEVAIVTPSDDSVSSGLVRQGDFIRIVAAFDGSEKDGGRRSVLIVDDALVLSASGPTQRPSKKQGIFSGAESGPAKKASGIAVAVSKGDALDLALAQKFGALTILNCGKTGCARGKERTASSYGDVIRKGGDGLREGFFEFTSEGPQR